MAYYHNYLINRKIIKNNIDKEFLSKNYNLNGFSIEQIKDFFDNYEDIEILRKNHLLYQGNTTQNPDKIEKSLRKYEKKYCTLAGQLYLSSLKEISGASFAHKNVSYFLKSSYFNILKYRGINLFINDESYLIKAIFDNDYRKIDYLMNSGLTVNKKLSILSKVGKQIHPLMLDKLLDYDLVDLKTKTQIPDLNQLVETRFPIKKMVSKGLNLEDINLIFEYNYYSISNPVNERERKRQEIYVELVEAGLNPNIPLSDMHLPLFYITHINLIKRLIKAGADINGRVGYKSLLTDIIFNPVGLEQDKIRKIEIVDFYLNKKAELGEKQNKGVLNNKIHSLDKIIPELYSTLIKYDVIDYDNLKISITHLNSNAKILAPLVVKNKLNLKNIIIDDFEIVTSIHPNLLAVIMHNLKNIDVKTPNGNTIAEQLLMDNCYEPIKDKITSNISLVGNEKFKMIYGIENGKITLFKNIVDEEMYDFFKSKGLFGVASQYPLEDLNKVMYSIGKRAFEDGYITNDIVNPIIDFFINPFENTVSIYAIKNKKLNLIKDKEGKNLLTKVNYLSMARKLIENNIEIQFSPNHYEEPIREYITEQLVSQEKEVLLKSMGDEAEKIEIKKKKRL